MEQCTTSPGTSFKSPLILSAHLIARMLRSFSRAFDREKLVFELVQLMQRERANVLLVGEAGVGKTSILVVAVRIVERDVRSSDNDSAPQEAKPAKLHRFWTSSAARLSRE